MTTHDVSGEETLRHLQELSRLSGLPRDLYLAEIRRVHGPEYRMALAREDIARRNEQDQRRPS